MSEPGGTVEHGKCFANSDSTCVDKSITVEKPGTDGGLVTGSYQAGPIIAFDKNGNALAGRILTAGSFTAIKFAVTANATDPADTQTRRRVECHRHQWHAVRTGERLVSSVEQPLLQPGITEARRISAGP